MKNGLYAVRDNVARIYFPPFMANNDDVAIRQFDFACRDSQSSIYQSPGDYDLCRVGYYDQETGFITICEVDIIARGFDYGKETSFNEV